MEQAGMGVGVGDYDLDGHLDLFKTHFLDDSNILYHNDGKGNFDDVTRASRIGVETRYICWGAGIVDLDNDGLPDLFMVTGHVYPEVERTLPQYPNKTPRAVFRNLGDGIFEELIEEAGPGVGAPHCSRGCAFGDFDNDGDIDILIINLNEPPSLLRNDLRGTTNHWIKVKLEGAKSNRSGIGARVLVHYGNKTQAQAVLSQSSFFPATTRVCISAWGPVLPLTLTSIGQAGSMKLSKDFLQIGSLLSKKESGQWPAAAGRKREIQVPSALGKQVVC